MEWQFEFALFFSAIIFVAGLFVALIVARFKRRLKYLKPLHAILVATFVSLVIIFFPVYLSLFNDSPYQDIQAFFVAAYMALRTFVINANIDDCFAATANLTPQLHAAYLSFATGLCIFSPVLVFSFALSMIKSVSAYWAYFLGRNKTAYIFSKLNERSFALAESTRRHHIADNIQKKEPLIVFTGVIDEKNAESYELVERAKSIGAIFFKRDLPSTPLAGLGFLRSNKAETLLILIGEDKEENNSQALEILQKSTNWSRDAAKTRLYVLESSIGSEILLDANDANNDNRRITIRRIDTVRSFVYNFLWQEGNSAIFAPAHNVEQNRRQIRAYLLGMGKTGTMMLKSLAWLCQMNGYFLTVDVFDKDLNIEKRLKAQVPELLSSKHNGNMSEDDAAYLIRFHPGVNINDPEFSERMIAAAMPTFVFISLGNDDLNIETAIIIKTILLRKQHFEKSRGDSAPVHYPDLESLYVVVHDLQRTKAMSDDDISDDRMTQTSKHDDMIKLVGGFNKIYSYDTIFAMKLEESAKDLHLHWYKNDPSKDINKEAEQFWRHENYRNSSMARVIHRDIRNNLLRNKDGSWPALDDELVYKLQVQEHLRWLAYTRSEGFVYSGSTERSTRNERAKIHNLLVGYSQLPENEKVLSSEDVFFG